MWTLNLCFIGYDLERRNGCLKLRRPLQTHLEEVERALEAKLYLAAVSLALMLPDICATLESAKAYSGNREYKKWYRENLASKFPKMSDEAAFSLRCGVVHQGNLVLKVAKQQMAARVVFTLPHRSVSLHNCVFGDMLQFDVQEFCHDIISAVNDWYDRKQADPVVQGNLPNLVRFGRVVNFGVMALS